MNHDTHAKIDKFVEESKDRGFVQAEFDKVKGTIPANEQVAAEAEVKSKLA